MVAQDYPVTFPYGATDSPYSAAHPHRGDDHPCPSGTPLVVGGVTIGLTGATGNVIGAHLHIQEWSGDYSNTRQPQNSFKPGTVVNVDPNGTQGDGSFGKFISVRTADGWTDTYCHLSVINATPGQVLKENSDMIIENTDVWRARANRSFQLIRGRDMGQGELDQWVGSDFTHLIEALEDDPEADAQLEAATTGRIAEKDNWPGQIYALEDQLKASQSIANQLNQAVTSAQNAGKADLQAALAKVADLTAQLQTANDRLAEVQTGNQLAQDTNNKVTSIFDYFVGQFKSFLKYVKR